MATFTVNAGETFDARDFGISSYAANGVPGATKHDLQVFQTGPGVGSANFRYWYDLDGNNAFDGADYFAGAFRPEVTVVLDEPSVVGTYASQYQGAGTISFIDLRTGLTVGELSDANYDFTVYTTAESGVPGGAATSWTYGIDQNFGGGWYMLLGDDTVMLDAGNDYFVDTDGQLTLDAGLGDDTIYAMGFNGGPDSIVAGGGDDVVYYQQGGHTIDGGAGNDEIGGVGNNGLPLPLTTFIGGAGDDVIYGSGHDSLFVEGDDSGNDSYIGFSGGGILSIVDYGSGASALVIDLYATNTSDTGIYGIDTFAGIGEIRATALDDSMIGTVGDDRFIGRDGDDRFEGREGDDFFDGGAGTDTADWSGAGTSIVIALDANGAGTTSMAIGIGTDTVAGVENIIGGFDADTIAGNALANALTGNNGNDVLDGGGGDDTLSGGLGNDGYVVDSLGDVMVELAGQGTDTVSTTLANYSLFALGTLERLTYTGTANFVGRGNALDNRVQGSSGNDRFVVDQSGADRYFGGAGSADQMDYRPSAVGAIVNLTTTVHGGAAAGDFFSSIEYFYGSNTAGDDLTGAGFNDRFDGYGGNDVLSGLGGTDTLNGGDGDDEIAGGALLDILTGNAGADDFNYADVSDSGPTSGARDRVHDFVAGIDDIDVSAIDAMASTGGDDAFTQFIGAAAFTAEGQIRAFQSGANTVIEFNTTGTSGAEMQIQLQNFTATNLTIGDFIL